MKKVMLTIAASVLTTLPFYGGSVSASSIDQISASQISIAKSVRSTDLTEIKNATNELLKYLEDNIPSNEAEAEALITQYYAQHNEQKKLMEDYTTDYYKTTGQKTILPHSNNSVNEEQSFNAYIEENLESNQFSSHKVSDNVRVISTNSPILIIESQTITPSVQLPPDARGTGGAISTMGVTNTVTHTYSAYGGGNARLYTVSVSGYFTYDNKAVSGHYDNAYYTRGNLSLWQVDDWSTGTKKTASGKAQVYAQGRFHFGAEIKGVGLVMEEHFVQLTIEGLPSGQVDRYTFKDGVRL